MAKRHKKNAKRDGKNNKNIPHHKTVGVVISPEDHEKFLAFCKIKDQLISLASNLEESWNEYCVYLVQELQIDPPIYGPGCEIDDTISKINDIIRPIKYSVPQKKKKNKWLPPLSGGVCKPQPNYYADNNLNKLDKKKLKKSEVILQHISTDRSNVPLMFTAFITIEDEEQELASLQQIIDEIERGEFQESGTCVHGNDRPCRICEHEVYPYCD